MDQEKNNKEEKGQPTPGENNPEKAIDTPKEVDEANDNKIDQDFPGYPHYPAKDDILNPENNNGQVELDVNNLSRSHVVDPLHIRNIEGVPPVSGLTSEVIPDENDDDLGIVSGTEADVTPEDLAMLGPRDGDMDMDEDEDLASRGWVPKDGADLDTQDIDLNDPTQDAMGQGDEENSYYSLGGDTKEGLEDTSSSTK